MSAVFDQWYVRVSGQDYGPYTDELMGRFVGEGRITETSEISADPANGFHAALRYADFRRWSDASGRPLTPAATPARTNRVTRHLVMAELRSGQSVGFLRQMQSYRQCTRIGDTVWLVDGAGDTAQLTAALRATLHPNDRMFVADITQSETGQAGFIDMTRVG